MQKAVVGKRVYRQFITKLLAFCGGTSCRGDAKMMMMRMMMMMMMMTEQTAVNSNHGVISK